MLNTKKCSREYKRGCNMGTRSHDHTSNLVMSCKLYLETSKIKVFPVSRTEKCQNWDFETDFQGNQATYEIFMFTARNNL